MKDVVSEQTPDALAFLFDGLGVESLAELHTLVERGRVAVVTSEAWVDETRGLRGWTFTTGDDHEHTITVPERLLKSGEVRIDRREIPREKLS